MKIKILQDYFLESKKIYSLMGSDFIGNILKISFSSFDYVTRVSNILILLFFIITYYYFLLYSHYIPVLISMSFAKMPMKSYNSGNNSCIDFFFSEAPQIFLH